ncbi:MAG: hypothetical protein JWL83_3641 [Actinomycetia bacterium]|nr:hypothetical protein [Actinomycetes bacterium]
MFRRVGILASCFALIAAAGLAPAGAAQQPKGESRAAAHRQAELLIARGMSGSARYAASAAPGVTVSGNDPIGDVDDPHADITHVSATYTAHLLTMSATLKQPTDPRTNPLWQGLDSAASLEWAINIGDSSFPQDIAFLGGGPHGTIVAGLSDFGYIGGPIGSGYLGGGRPPCAGVQGTYDAGTGTYTIRIPSDCLSNAPAVHVATGMIIWNGINSPFPINQPPTVDVAPDHGSLTPAGVPGGYALVSDDGGAFTFGSVSFHGSLGRVTLASPIADVAGTASGKGYLMLGADGGVFTFGNALFFGSAAGRAPGDPFVGIALTPTGRGYWLLTASGGVFSYGDARFHGATFGSGGGRAVDIVSTPSGKGYWVALMNGGVRAFGDAQSFGNAAAVGLTHPIVAIVPTPTGRGYWLIASDGGVFTYGDARFLGSTGAIRLESPIVGAAASPTGRGYTMVAGDGGIFRFGDARWFGSAGDFFLRRPMIGFAAFSDG